MVCKITANYPPLSKTPAPELKLAMHILTSVILKRIKIKKFENIYLFEKGEIKSHKTNCGS